MTNIHRTSPGPRWWPAIAVALAGALAFAWVWWPGADRSGQDRVFMTMPLLLGTVLLLAIWLVFFSRLRGRTRGLAITACLVGVAIAAATLRVRGVTGDLVPILEWRWTTRTDAALAPLPTTEPTPPATVDAPPPQVPAVPSVPPGMPPPAAAAPATLPTSGDYPQFLGPDRNGMLAGIRLARNWAATPPRLVWKQRVGAGWSGFAIANGIAVTQEQRGDREMVVAYDLAKGIPKWSHADTVRFESTVAGDGPRATPTISRGRVYSLGSTGVLNCLDLPTGRRIWTRDIGRDHDAVQPEWGRSGSPLVLDDLVIVSAGGANGRSLVAYQRHTGEPAWHAGSDPASYSSPLVATLAGVRQVLMLNQGSVTAHDPASGRILWEHPWPGPQPTVAQPVILPGDRVLLSAGYGIGSKLLQITGSPDAGLRSSLVWESPRMKAKFTNLVVHDGFVYGLDDGVLVCLDPADGERRWKSGRYGHGQVILAGDLLLVQTEEGEIMLVEPRPDAHRELARLTVFTQKTWNPPALAGRFLLVRNDAEAACYELSLER